MQRLALHDQITAMRAAIERAKGFQSIDLANRTFNRESWKLYSDVALEWLDARIKFENHLMELANKSLSLSIRSDAFIRFKARMAKLSEKIRAKKKLIKRTVSNLKHAEKIYEGPAIDRHDYVQAWRKFGVMAKLSRLPFPATSGATTFYQYHRRKFRRVETSTEQMSMFELATICRENKLMVDPLSVAFDSINELFVAESVKILASIESSKTEIAELQTRFDGVLEKNWTKAGIL